MAAVARIHAEIELRDKLSKPLGNAEDKIEAFAARAGQNIKRFAQGAKADWEAFGKSLDTVSSKIQATGVAMAAGITAPLGLMAKAAASAAGELESMVASMSAITGSTAAAEAQLAELEKMAGRTASSYADLVRASKGLIAGFDGDVDSSNYVLERFATLANVLGVGRADFERMVVNLTQIGGATRLAGDELREMSAILPNMRTLLKKAFGTNQSEELAKMGITGREALEGIAKAIDEKGYKAKTDTYIAQTQRLNTEFFKLKVAIGDALLPLIKNVQERLLPAMTAWVERLKSATPAQRNMALGLAALAAAAGPALIVLGSLGKAIAGIIALRAPVVAVFRFLESGLLTLAANGGAMIGLSRGATLAQGALVGLRGAFALLTGPVGIAIGLATALFVAWQKNIFGIQDIVKPFIEKVGKYFGELRDNVGASVGQLVETIVEWWESVGPTIQPLLDGINAIVNTSLKQQFDLLEGFFRAATDIINVGLGLFQILWGGTWDEISDATKASASRMEMVIKGTLANVAQFVLDTFKAFTGLASLLPGIGGQYDKLVGDAQEWITSLRLQSAAAYVSSVNYDMAAAAARRLAKVQEDAAKKPKPKLGSTPTNPNATIGGKLGAGDGLVPPLAVKVPDNIKQAIEDLRRSSEEWAAALKEIAPIEKEIYLTRLKASGATLKDIISFERFSKLYADIQKASNKAIVDAMERLELTRREVEAERLAAEAVKARADAYSALSRSAVEAGGRFAQERELLNATTEEERARWEVTRGGYSGASAFAKAFYVLQARLLDQSRAAKTQGEAWAATWSTMIAKVKEFNQTARDKSLEKLGGYLENINERLLEMGSSAEELLRVRLAEEFAGLAAGASSAEEAFTDIQAAIDKVVSGNKEVEGMERKLELIRTFAKGMEDAFMGALDNMFENGFRSFFDDVIGGFRAMVRDMAAEFVRLQIQRAILWGVNQIGGAGTATFGGLFGKAAGGMVSPGVPYLVGEQGPEMVVPSQAGRVVPNHQLGGGEGGNTIINVEIKAPTYNSWRKSEGQLLAEAFGRAARKHKALGG